MKLLEKAKQISGLTLQPRFPLVVKEKKITTYVADFLYTTTRKNPLCWSTNGVESYLVAEDSKGHRTKDYIIKAKLFKALHPHIEHREV